MKARFAPNAEPNATAFLPEYGCGSPSSGTAASQPAGAMRFERVTRLP